jgi:hypothetical protein
VSNEDPIGGYVVKGPATGATVNLFSVAADGAKTLIESTTSDATGRYSFSATPTAGSVVLVEASGGSFLDEITAQRVPLTSTLRALAVGTGAPIFISLTPFSETAVREIELTTPQEWTASRASAVNTEYSEAFAVANLLAFKPVDFRDLSSIASSSDDDFFLALQLGAFSGMLHRLGNPQSVTTFAEAMRALRVTSKDPYDDEFTTAILGGVLDFIDVSAYPADTKRSLKGLFALRNEFALESEIAAAMPTGRASGFGIAPMPNNVLEWVPNVGMARQSPIGSMFNSRGALIAYQLSPSFPTYRYLYSGSVGELYADGDVGIGRWHGGLMFDATDGAALDVLVNPVVLDAENGLPYAMARPATNLPSCGVRTLTLAGSTMTTQTAGFVFKPVTGLTPDSEIAVQYSGPIAYLGFDIGLQFSDGSSFRATTLGGAKAPWASGVSTTNDGYFSLSFAPTNPPAQLPDLRIDANGILAGFSGRKTALMIRLYSPHVDAMTLSAAFNGPETISDTSACTPSGAGDGSSVNPVPTDDWYWLFGSADSMTDLYRGAPLQAAFTATGSLSRAGFDLNAPILAIPPESATFDLFGTGGAVIGRVKGPFNFDGAQFNQSLPFAAAKPAGSLPLTGTRQYRLVSASAPIVFLQSDGVVQELPPGQVTNAALSINFGEFPTGIPSPFYGSVRFSIDLDVAGLSFNLTNSVDSTGTVRDVRYSRDSGNFGGSTAIEGAISGPTGEYAVVHYDSFVAGRPIRGVLLFEQE